VGYGCTTCIGNSGPLEPARGASPPEGYRVLGNRNFEVYQSIKGTLMSPCVAYALAGNVLVDLVNEPLEGHKEGRTLLKGDGQRWRDQRCCRVSV